MAIPALLATAAVHHHLDPQGICARRLVWWLNQESRAKCITFAALAGYGAEAINPYLAFETLGELHKDGKFPEEVDAFEVVQTVYQGD